jgi:hypothetical protein
MGATAAIVALGQADRRDVRLLAGDGVQVRSQSRPALAAARLAARWQTTLREIVPKLRCSRPGCRSKPSKVQLRRSAGLSAYQEQRERWYQLVPAGDEEMFPH